MSEIVATGFVTAVERTSADTSKVGLVLSSLQEYDLQNLVERLAQGEKLYVVVRTEAHKR